jgi:plasmid maintenance system antidote protein VapI
MSVNALALALNVPASRIDEIVKERRSITADTAERGSDSAVVKKAQLLAREEL